MRTTVSTTNTHTGTVRHAESAKRHLPDVWSSSQAQSSSQLESLKQEARLCTYCAKTILRSNCCTPNELQPRAYKEDCPRLIFKNDCSENDGSANN